MQLKEFVEKGYKINAQVKVIETQEVNLDDLKESGQFNDVDDCRGEVIDTWLDDSDPAMISYDILDPDGNLISGYEAKLFNHDDVMKFIAKL